MWPRRFLGWIGPRLCTGQLWLSFGKKEKVTVKLKSTGGKGNHAVLHNLYCIQSRHSFLQELDGTADTFSSSCTMTILLYSLSLQQMDLRETSLLQHSPPSTPSDRNLHLIQHKCMLSDVKIEKFMLFVDCGAAEILSADHYPTSAP